MKNNPPQKPSRVVPNEGYGRVEVVLFGCLALLSIVLMCQRLSSAVNPSEGPWIVTTGFEQEALNTIWHLVNNRGEAYPDPASIPYRGSFFNAGFYGIYSLWTGNMAALLGWDSASIVPLGRMLTLGWTALAIWGLWALLRRNKNDMAALGGAVAMTFSPLISYWAGSVRPDMASIALELAAAVWACRLFKSIDSGSDDPIALILVGLFALAAWSMKQSAVVTITAVCLVLIVRKQWKPLLLLVSGTWAAYAVFLILGGETYRYWLIWAHLEFPGSWVDSVRIGVFSAIQSPIFPVSILILLLALLRGKVPHPMRSSIHLFAWIWLVLAGLASFLAARKYGAGSNYFILLTLISFWWAWRLSFRVPGFRAIWAGGVVLQGGVVLAVILGLWGRELAIPRQLDAHRLLHEFISTKADGPVFVDYGPGNLPWISPVTPHFVLAHNYPFSGPHKPEYEKGGVRGLMDQGFFHMVVQPRAQSWKGPPHPLYSRRIHRDEYFTYFSREFGAGRNSIQPLSIKGQPSP